MPQSFVTFPVLFSLKENTNMEKENPPFFQGVIYSHEIFIPLPFTPWPCIEYLQTFLHSAVRKGQPTNQPTSHFQILFSQSRLAEAPARNNGIAKVGRSPRGTIAKVLLSTAATTTATADDDVTIIVRRLSFRKRLFVRRAEKSRMRAKRHR